MNLELNSIKKYEHQNCSPTVDYLNNLLDSTQPTFVSRLQLTGQMSFTELPFVPSARRRREMMRYRRLVRCHLHNLPKFGGGEEK
jgi:hypothetical protein